MCFGKFLALLMVLVSLSGTQSETNIETQFLERINNYRRSHGCPDLQLNEEMCKDAQYNARILARKSTLERSVKNNMGESHCTSYNDPLKCVDDWYAEEKFYDYDQHKYVKLSEDFTQMIWKTSQFLGIGLYKDKTDGKIIVVAKYYPVGNEDGLFLPNVPQKSFYRSNGLNRHPNTFFSCLSLIVSLNCVAVTNMFVFF